MSALSAETQCRRGDCSMSSVRDWTTGFAVIGTILLGPIIAFLTVVAAEVLIDFLKERAVIAAIAVYGVVAGMIGSRVSTVVVFRCQRLLRQGFPWPSHARRWTKRYKISHIPFLGPLPLPV
jgi:hypothetical protein